METDTMLNQFIQICIQLRNVGAVATGCLIDGLIIVVDGSLGHATRLTPRLTYGARRPDSGSEPDYQLVGELRRYLRLRQGDTPHPVGQWQQG